MPHITIILTFLELYDLTIINLKQNAMKKLMTILAISGLTFMSLAQAPEKMSYQALIRNASGGLVTNHAIGMRISILQG